jgi:hypothetical protein
MSCNCKHFWRNCKHFWGCNHCVEWLYTKVYKKSIFFDLQGCWCLSHEWGNETCWLKPLIAPHMHWTCQQSWGLRILSEVTSKKWILFFPSFFILDKSIDFRGEGCFKGTKTSLRERGRERERACSRERDIVFRTSQSLLFSAVFCQRSRDYQDLRCRSAWAFTIRGRRGWCWLFTHLLRKGIASALLTHNTIKVCRPVIIVSGWLSYYSMPGHGHVEMSIFVGRPASYFCITQVFTFFT